MKNLIDLLLRVLFAFANKPTTPVVHIEVENLPEPEPTPEENLPDSYEVEVPDHDYIELGDSGEHVEELQRLIRSKGIAVDVDGKFGPQTEGAVIQLQTRLGLVADGKVGPKTMDSIRGIVISKYLSQSDIVDAAKLLGVSVPAIMAVSEVESRGKGFFSNGLPSILFERHIMRRRLIHYKIDPTPFLVTNPNLVNASPGGYSGGVREYVRLNDAKRIHRASAQESASWGAYQIMGFHWGLLGFTSAEQFVLAMKESERNQLMAFVRFIKADARLLRAIRANDWTTFARIYNGPNFHINKYDEKMASAFARFSYLDREGRLEAA